MSMFDKQSLIQRLKGLPFPEKEYWVVAGGAMVLHGFRPQTHDIDLGCSTLLADELEQQGYFVSHPIRSLAQAYVYYQQCTPFGDSDRVSLTCSKRNQIALRIYEKAGFELTGNSDEDEVEPAMQLR